MQKPAMLDRGASDSSNDAAAMKEATRFWVHRDLGGLECMHTRYRSHCFAPHTHDTFVIGQISRGYQNYRNKGVERIWGSGDILVINPDDLHDCRPGEQGSEYRTFYPDADMMKEIARQISGKEQDMPWFAVPQIEQDPELTDCLMQLNLLLDGCVDRLQLETKWLEVMGLLVLRHSDYAGSNQHLGDDAVLIQQVCDYMNDNLAEDVDLQSLADLIDMNKFRLIRSFKKMRGISPHAYRLNQRLSRAKSYLSKGMGLAEAAISCGFYDQAHFSKSFKRAIGITPRSYQQAYCAG